MMQWLPMMLSCRDMYGREDNDVRAVRNVPEGIPTIIEDEFDLKQREVIVFTGWSLPTMRKIGVGARDQRLLSSVYSILSPSHLLGLNNAWVVLNDVPVSADRHTQK